MFLYVTLLIIAGLFSKWTWKRANFVLQIQPTAVCAEMKITTLHFKLVPWQPTHQNPLDIVCKWTGFTCILWKSISLYSPKWSVTLLTVQKHSLCSGLYSKRWRSWICLIIENTLKHPLRHGRANGPFWQRLFNDSNVFLWCVCIIKTHIHSVCFCAVESCGTVTT